METQAMTVRLPKELYERLRREAFENRVSQASIVIDAIEKRLGADDGQDCQATHCPPSATQDCDWPRCAGQQP